jgi:uncharacterized protein (DUF433 family)
MTMAWSDRISSDPAICGGVPCVKGTRIMVSVVLQNLAGGMAAERIIQSYPRLTVDDVRACLEFAAELASDRVLNLPKSA